MSSNNYTPPNPSQIKAKGSEKKVTKRAVSLNRRIALIFSVFFALFVILLLTSSTPKTYVVVASKDIQPLTALSKDNLTVIAVDKSAVELNSLNSDSKEGAIKKLESFIGTQSQTNKINILAFKNKQMHDDYIAPQLADDEQLISISAKSGDAVVGIIRPNDFVDVWAGLPSGAVSLVASNVMVYSLGLSQDQLDSIANTIVSKPETQKTNLLPGNPLPGSYVLKIKTSDVLKFLAISNSTNNGGRVYLSLRSDGIPTEISGAIDAHTIICGSRNDPVCSRK